MGRKLWILFLVCLSANWGFAQTNGTLAVSVITSSTGGNYAPRNVVAIWIEDNSGKFVKTLLAYAHTRKTHLNTWEASTTASGSAFNVTDAISGATQNSHGTLACQWNSKDYTGKLMADGDYKVRMELTDKNGTGNVASFTFTKGPNAQKLSPANVPSFSSISLNWTTSVTGNNPELTTSNTFIVYPNPGSGQFTVIGENIIGLEVKDLSGKTICKSKTPIIDLTDKPKGIYLVSIWTGKETVVRKIIKE
jgi:hypothetical protein